MDSEREEFLLEHIKRLGDIIEQSSKRFCEVKRELATLEKKYRRAIKCLEECQGPVCAGKSVCASCWGNPTGGEHRPGCEREAILAEAEETK